MKTWRSLEEGEGFKKVLRSVRNNIPSPIDCIFQAVKNQESGTGFQTRAEGCFWIDKVKPRPIEIVDLTKSNTSMENIPKSLFHYKNVQYFGNTFG